MKCLFTLFVPIILFSCKKEDILVSSLLISTKWDLIETREKPTCCNLIKDFSWINYKVEGNIVTYEFTSNQVIEYSLCPICSSTAYIQKGTYIHEDNLLKIIGDTNNTSFRIHGNWGTQVLKLTNDTLIIGKKYGREGDYSEFKFVKIK